MEDYAMRLSKFVLNISDGVELSFVDSIIEIWKLSWLTNCSRNELAVWRFFFPSRSSIQQSATLEQLMLRETKFIQKMASEQLFEGYFLQYIFFFQLWDAVFVILVREGMNLIFKKILWKIIIDKRKSIWIRS